MEEINEITAEIVDAAIKVHKTLGPGLFESVYEEALSYELVNRGLIAARQKQIPVVYKEIKMELGFRADILVENCVIVEIKAIESIAPIHKKQVQTYLRLTDLKIGLLLNFNEVLLKDGITRVFNNYAP